MSWFNWIETNGLLQAGASGLCIVPDLPGYYAHQLKIQMQYTKNQIIYMNVENVPPVAAGIRFIQAGKQVFTIKK